MVVLITLRVTSVVSIAAAVIVVMTGSGVVVTVRGPSPPGGARARLANFWSQRAAQFSYCARLTSHGVICYKEL
jgi:hypothetical protein